MKRLAASILCISLIVATCGCNVSRPKLVGPGTAEYQQARAQQFDPYPETDIGPEIVGGRPIDYEKPPAEVRRVQPPVDWLRSTWLPWNWNWH